MCLRFLLKLVLIVVNLVFVVLGVALVALGVLIKLQLESTIKELESAILEQTDGNLSLDTLGLPVDLGFVAYAVIGLGVIIFIIAFCGCCGSIVNSKCMLVTYTVFMTILLIIKIVALVLLLTNVDSWKEEVKNFVDDAFEQPELNVTFHVMEALLQCCGTTGPDSYDFSYQGVAYVPATCCPGALDVLDALDSLNGVDQSQVPDNIDDLPEALEAVNSTICLKDEAFTAGCSNVIVEFTEMVLNTTRNVLIIIIIAEAVLMLSALTVTCMIKSNSSKKRY